MSSNTAVAQSLTSKNQFDRVAPRRLARIAGILYLIIIISGIFAEFFVRQSLIVPGDAAATASSIVAAESLFRLGIAADLIMIIADVALALVFYFLFKPVSNILSLMAAFFRLAQAVVLGINLLNLFFALQLLTVAGIQAAFPAAAPPALALLFLGAHSTGYALGLMFFGVNLLILGYLALKSGYFPRLLGILVIVAALGYLLDTFARVLLPNYSDLQPIFDLAVFGPAFIAELSLALWLLFKGVKVGRRDNSHVLPAPQVEERPT